MMDLMYVDLIQVYDTKYNQHKWSNNGFDKQFTFEIILVLVLWENGLKDVLGKNFTSEAFDKHQNNAIVCKPSLW